MSKKSRLFENLLRKIVREELTNVLRSELKHLTEKEEESLSLTTMLGEEEQSMSTVSTSNTNSSTRSPKVKLSNNPLLEGLINSSTPIGNQGLASDFLSDSSPTHMPVGLEGKPVNLNNPAVQDTLDIINRDYSSLMSKINKK